MDDYSRYLELLNARPREPRECTYDIYTPPRLGHGHDSEPGFLLVHAHPAHVANLTAPVSARGSAVAHEWRDTEGERRVMERVVELEKWLGGV